MSIASFLEKTVIGDKNIKRDANRLGDFGTSEYAAGQGLADEGVNGVRSIMNDYRNRLSSGRVLPSNVYRAYDIARGHARDTAARGTMAAAADINQRALSSGGFLSPEAREELYGARARAISDGEFDATTNIDADQAKSELSSTTDLMSRLESLTGTILNAGQFRQQLGQAARIQGLMARIIRATAISSAGTSAGVGAMH